MLQVAGFVPPDGQGLNDLLQNPWMTIHPPTLFVGFTLLMVPFAFAVAGLMDRGRYTQWVRPALPWALAGSGVLGVGIMMGGWWAYETLSFGGWWAWDPVENSSLGAVDLRRGRAARDGGPEKDRRRAQGGAVAERARLPARHLLDVPDALRHPGRRVGAQLRRPRALQPAAALDRDDRRARLRAARVALARPARSGGAAGRLSRESLVFTGALLLAVTGGVIALGTSAPILGKLFRDNPSAVPIAFYNTWTLPLAVGIALLAGMGQLFWWRKMSVEDANRVLLKPGPGDRRQHGRRRHD